MWHQHFINESNSYDQSKSLIQLLYNVTVTYLNDCTPVILYDDQINSTEGYLLQNLMKNFPVDFVHGVIDDKKRLIEPNILRPKDECLHYILFINDVKSSASVLGKQSNNKIVVITKSSQWAVQEFLSSSMSRIFADLLVIDQSFKEDDDSLEAPYILYTHQLYSDGLGTSKPFILTSWKKGKFSRNVNLFPRKISEGYAGHRFLIAAANQPPFVFKKHVADADGGNPRIVWDGIEIRILKVLSELNNFTIEIVEPRDLHLGPSDAVANEIALERSDIGVAGLYLTTEIIRDMEYSFAHSQDCAAFVTLASTALPRYRAILGPFHWHVWVALTFTYLIAIFPLAFSDKHTLSHLINNTGEVENMFWYVFGTFTNCFTFVGKNSWSKTDKITTRLLIGWYWLFTIIITSCYTGSIIAFVTLPLYPETVDSVQQLLSGFYRVGTLDRGGWERWFLNSSDQNTNKLMKKLEFVRDIETGIRNVTKAFFFPYAFLGSKSELEYLIQANFSKSELYQLHLGLPQ
ncbi:ionotropic receptor 21a [Leptidea sinapis]|uniref:ionotropic receptor 21a n=1 Tax=Leptidea sinapis TaxID=189913 RepID=UPI0021C3F456|nr:ionotropic receptor 21a [Leptidea sinapis]